MCRASRISILAWILACGFHAAAAADEPHPALEVIDRAAVAMRIDPEASRHDAERALTLIATRPDPDLEVRARLLLCDYLSERDRAAAEAQIDRIEAVLPAVRRKGLRAGLLTCQGEVLETAAENGGARARYDEAVAEATRHDDREMRAGALFARGYLLGVQGEYAAGLADLRASEELYAALSMPQHALTALNSIAILYSRMGDFAGAKRIYRRALEAQRAAGLRREEAVTLHNLARAHEHIGEWTPAREAFQASLDISRSLAYARGEAYALRGLAAQENARGAHSVALVTLAQADALQRRTPDARLRAQISLARGIALAGLGRSREALAALESALAVFREAEALGELATTYGALADLHRDMGDWRAAYERQSDAAATTERLLRNQLDQRFATLKVEYDTSARERENASLLRENLANSRALEQARRVRQLLAVAIGLGLVVVALLAFVVLRQRGSTRRMEALAKTDELTGAPNRRAVLERLEALLEGPVPQGCAVLVIDVDHFKRINDDFGHPVGDEVLRDLAARIGRYVRDPGYFGRMGGEEFIVVLPGTSLEAACREAEALREHVMTYDTRGWHPQGRPITASIGVSAAAPGGEDSVSMLLKRADEALYAAKKAGRNCVRWRAGPAGTTRSRA
jgi:diguanylate cyclase (GGDEF)-like protein